MLVQLALLSTLAAAPLFPQKSTAVEVIGPDGAKVNTISLLVDHRPGAAVYSLPASHVISLGVYLDLDANTMSIPQIGHSAPATAALAVKSALGPVSGQRWDVDENLGSGNRRRGAVLVGRVDARPEVCVLMGDFQKTLAGKELLKEQFTVAYACPRR